MNDPPIFDENDEIERERGEGKDQERERMRRKVGSNIVYALLQPVFFTTSYFLDGRSFRLFIPFHSFLFLFLRLSLET